MFFFSGNFCLSRAVNSDTCETWPLTIMETRGGGQARDKKVVPKTMSEPVNTEQRYYVLYITGGLWYQDSCETRPSILCVTHQMSQKKKKICSQLVMRWWIIKQYWLVLDGTGSVYDDTGWYLVSIRRYCLVLGGTGSAKGLLACIYWRKSRFVRVLPMPDTDRQTTEYRASQLV